MSGAAPPGLPADLHFLSVVVPVRDEVESLEALLRELDAALGGLPIALEWIFVDDASRDGSGERLLELARRDPRLRVLRLERHGGQSAALDAGFRAARGDAIATLDADGQNDPADLPRMLCALREADVVNGVRRDRRDGWRRRAASRLAGAVRRRVLGDGLRDTGCSLRVARARFVRRLRLERGLHRFVPVLLAMEGARLVEVEVAHRPRLHGTAKYGVLDRLLPAVADLYAVARMQRRAQPRLAARTAQPPARFTR